MSRIVICGEAWGEDEETLGHPFVGASGRELIRQLGESFGLAIPKQLWSPSDARDWWLTQETFFPTNCFNLRPKPKNDISNLCVPKKEDKSGLPAIKPGNYIKAEYLPELDRLRREILDQKPNLIIALGGTAAWALLRQSGISKIRGTITESVSPPGFKVLPAYHPAAVLRQWELRHVTILDLIKARREAEFPDIRRPERTVYVEPTLDDLEWFYDTHIVGARLISFDIETAGDQITCIGFAPSPGVAIVVPFVDHRKPGGSYWPDGRTETLAWTWVRRVLGTPTPKVGQNVIYDMHFLWRRYGIPVVNPVHDTMLLHHALQPESEKGLAFLGSVYTNEASWKLLRKKKSDTIKRDA